MPMTFNEAYKEWRNRARKFSAASMFRAALTELRKPASPMDDLKKRPWNLLLLMKWVCQDQMLDTVRRDIDAQNFEQLRQALWDMPEQANLVISDTLPLRLYLRQRLYQQLAFQKRLTLGFIRDAAILDAQPANHPLRLKFELETGLSVSQFIDLAFTLTSQIVADSYRPISLRWFDVFRQQYPPAAVDRFISGISLSESELFAFCRALPDVQKKTVSEYFDFTVFTQRPFLRNSNDLFLLHPAVFYRAMEGYVHARLSKLGTDYIEPFSQLFELHVIEEARTTGVTFHGEASLIDWLPLGSQVPDGLLEFDECNVFIESKAGLFPEAIMTSGNAAIFEHKTRPLANAANQGWAAAAGLRSEGKAPPRVLAAPIDYLLIVTNRELSAGNGQSLSDMYLQGRLQPPSAIASNLLPLSHIYCMVIDDFEALMAAVRLGSIQLPRFLSECVERDESMSTARAYMHQHLQEVQIPRYASALLRDAIEAAENRLKLILPNG